VSCVEAYAELGRKLDEAEARLWAVLAATRAPSHSMLELRKDLERAEELLKTPCARHLLLFAQGA